MLTSVWQMLCSIWRMSCSIEQMLCSFGGCLVRLHALNAFVGLEDALFDCAKAYFDLEDACFDLLKVISIGNIYLLIIKIADFLKEIGFCAYIRYF